MTQEGLLDALGAAHLIAGLARRAAAQRAT
jgi:hypothetical protein